MSETIRCFFALWPDQDVREALVRVGKENLPRKARPVRRDNLHITLAFLGNIPSDSVDCYLQAASSVRFSSFTLLLNELGYFPRPKVFWAGASETPAALRNLYTDLNNAIRTCGYEPETRPFVPHITLARHCPFLKPGTLDPVITWEANRFCLVQSHTFSEGVEYRVMHEWPAAETAQ